MSIETLGNITVLAGILVLFSFSAYKYISQNKKYSQNK